MLARLRSLARMLFHSRQWRRDLGDELAFHIEEQADQLQRSGVARAEARRRARLEFGAVGAYTERCREAHGARWFDELSRNIVYAWRSIRRNPGFSAIAVISLMLGIGANLAVFNVLHRLVLAKLPVREPDQLYQLVVVQTNGPHYRNPYPKFLVMRDNFDVFKPLFGWGSFPARITAGQLATDRGRLAGVTGDYFDTLGIRPAVGRLLTARDERDETANIAVITYRLWQTAFAGDPGVVGKSLSIEGQAGSGTPFRIIGVTPSTFTGLEPGLPPDVYLPLAGVGKIRPNAITGAGLLWFHIMGRLPPGTSVESVGAVLRERWAQLDEPNRQRFTRNTHDMLLLEDGSHGYSDARQEFSGGVVVLMGLVAAVFLIACANLTTLLFVRGAGRTREMSVRLALGAGRFQLVRQWMTECLVLAVIGGLAGLVTARWMTDLLLRFVSEADRPWLKFHADGAVVLVGIALTFLAGSLSGLFPALRATGARPEPLLRSYSGGLTERRGPLAQGVLAGQLAVSLVLVVGGALFARTLWNLNSDSGGFDRRDVVYGIPDFGAAQIPRSRQADTVRDVVDRLQQSALVAAVSTGSPPMIWGDSGFGLVTGVTGYTLEPDEDNTVYANDVSRGYFDVLKIPLLAGRDFDEHDRPEGNARTSVVIINEHMARHYFQKRNPIGEKILEVGAPMEIIGVVRDTNNASLRALGRDVAYMPIATGGWSAVLARPKPGIPLSALEAEMRAAFAASASRVAVDVQPLEQAVQRSLGRDRLVAQLSATFGLLGLLLASIGLYGAIAYSVNSRTREIGIRMAVGAEAPDVAWMILQEGLAVTGAGIVVGIPLAIVGSRLIASLLFGVSPWDPLTLAVSSTVLAGVGLAAGFWPARRAARLDPARTLRCE
jgi:putative ABC transport system permease protein